MGSQKLGDLPISRMKSVSLRFSELYHDGQSHDDST